MAINKLDELLSKKDQDAIASLQQQYQNAKTDEERLALHNQAEAIRANNGYSGGADGSQVTSIPKNQTNSPYTAHQNNPGYNYTPAGDWYGDRNLIGQDVQDQISRYQDAYYATDDPAVRAALHDAAEALRAQAGYSGGADGSQTIYLGAGGAPQAPSFPGFSYGGAPTYDDRYSDRADQMLNDLLNRDKFSYDALNDPLYAQYKEQYQREGDRAMKDTLGQVAARTGGLASSYGESAAQQANQYYSQQLADKIPELYQMAYQMYLDDIDLKVQDLGLLNNASDREYGRYRDTMGDWRNDRDFAYGMYRDDIGDKKWQTEFNNGNFWADKNFNYQAGRDQIMDDRYNQEWQYGVGRDQLEDERYDDNTAYERAMQRWQSTGVVSASDAAILGVPAGTKYQDYKKTGSSSGGGSKVTGNTTGGGATAVIEEAIRWAEEHNSDPEVYIGNNWSGTWKNKTAGLDALKQYLAENDGGNGGKTITGKDGLSETALNKLNALASMAGSMSNRYPDSNGRYPVENTILLDARDGTITADEAVYMLKYFGYDPSKYFDL